MSNDCFPWAGMPMLLFGLWVVRSVTLVSSASSKKETAKNFSLIFSDHYFTDLHSAPLELVKNTEFKVSVARFEDKLYKLGLSLKGLLGVTPDKINPEWITVKPSVVTFLCIAQFAEARLLSAVSFWMWLDCRCLDRCRVWLGVSPGSAVRAALCGRGQKLAAGARSQQEWGASVTSEKTSSLF